MAIVLPPTLDLVVDAGHRPATRGDARAVLRLVAGAERRHPGGLLAQSTRCVPRPAVTAITALGVLQALIAGDLIYDPTSNAALAVMPLGGERRLRRTLAATGIGLAAGLATGPVVLALLIGAQLLPPPVPDIVALALLAGAALGLTQVTRTLWHRQRHLRAAGRRGPTIYAGSYVAAPGAGGRLLTDLVAACDRAGVTVACETTGEARIRRFRTVGLRVVAVTVPSRAGRHRFRPGREARVFMARTPTGTADITEVAAQHWQRPRPAVSARTAPW
jgi:hypothetical protein